MPSQRSSTGSETVRLADVFVRLPTDHQRSSTSTAPQGQNMDSSEGISAPAQRRLSSASREFPLTPQKGTSQVFEPATQIHRLPPTPDATPTKTLKRSRNSAILDLHTRPSSVKRHRTSTAHPTPSPSPHRRLLRTPKFSIVYQPQPRQKERKEALSWMELKRVTESVMKQVDWEDVAEDVASNRSAGMYKRIVRDVLQERIEELVGCEE